MAATTFDSPTIEARWAAFWEEHGLFRPERPDAPPFTVLLPPPNVTGSLHMGHALNHTLQDILVRRARMQGHDARWVAGTDHAGIATQMVVERLLAARGTSRRALGRERFEAEVLAWKEQSGSIITRQMRRLGVSVDWANERFTMDEAYVQAVRHAFVELYRRGLIYRAKRLVNWDPALGTAISDLEVEAREVDGHFWHLSYPLADGRTTAEGARALTVATTRPETMLGDTAVAVHPDDERYRPLVGGAVVQPLTGRRLPVVADPWADPEVGTGVVKITPAHDHNDWKVFERHPEIGHRTILDAAGRIVDSDEVPEAYRGMDRFEARQRIVADLEAAGLVAGVEPRRIQVPHGDRSGAIIEPMLTDQWFVDAQRLAGPALAAVEQGATGFVPESWRRTYEHWLENIEPWCISRQLWWGHRIPAWHGDDGSVHVAHHEAEAQAAAGPGVRLSQDEDVLDTWFSAALWPFATQGWPDDGGWQRRLPTDILVTAFDIIFFWVARMMMQSLEFTGEVPFRRVYCHGLVRDASGAKMSKSKGNTLDPLDLADRYGADALRFTLAALETQGRDVRLDPARVEGYRNFATKLWNAARFAGQQGALPAARAAAEPLHPVNRWILTEARAMLAELDAALEEPRFDLAADALYRFGWNQLCDWYLELAKPLIAQHGAVADETRGVLGGVLRLLLSALHPFMPFLTEELAHQLEPEGQPLIVSPWPRPPGVAGDDAAAEEVRWLIDLVSRLRSVRSELNVPSAARPAAWIAEPANPGRLERLAPLVCRMARLASLREGSPPPGHAVAALALGGETLLVDLEGSIDLEAERARLTRETERLAAEAEGLARRLADPRFLERAKPEAVATARERSVAIALERARLDTRRAALGGAAAAPTQGAAAGPG